MHLQSKIFCKYDINYQLCTGAPCVMPIKSRIFITALEVSYVLRPYKCKVEILIFEHNIIYSTIWRTSNDTKSDAMIKHKVHARLYEITIKWQS